MATGGGCCRALPPLEVVSGSARDVLDESVYEGSEAPPPPRQMWADVPADILGTVLRLLPCVADRASVRSVCRHWRAAARVQTALPVLVLPRFTFSCLTSDGLLTSPRRALMPVMAAGDDVRILGSCDDWLMAAKHDGECFLVNAFSSVVVHLPRLQSGSYYRYSCLDAFSREAEQFSRSFLLSSALSASPSSSVSKSKYIVAAYTYCRCGPDPGLAIWQPGMTSWYLCLSKQINCLSGDLAFYQRKLYMAWKYTASIFAFELREDEHRVSLSCPKHYRIDPFIPSRNSTVSRRSNLVVWRGQLLLIIRFFSHQIIHNMECNLRKVEVFALDFSTSPCGVTQIHNFHGDSIFVQKSGCLSFSADSHVGVQGDLIYFLDEGITDHVSYTYVHNMRDGTLRRIAAGLPLPNSGVPEECFLNHSLVWIFPSS